MFQTTIHRQYVAPIVLAASQRRCMINIICCMYSKATSFPVGKAAWGVKLTAHWHMVLSLKTSGGDSSPLPFTSSSHMNGQIYLYFCVMKQRQET